MTHPRNTNEPKDRHLGFDTTATQDTQVRAVVDRLKVPIGTVLRLAIEHGLSAAEQEIRSKKGLL